MAELRKIRQERADEAAQQERTAAAEAEKAQRAAVMKGNPLLNDEATNFTVKQRWDEDVPFKNCAQKEKRASGVSFVNDTLRSDFHRRFMSKYVQ